MESTGHAFAVAQIIRNARRERMDIRKRFEKILNSNHRALVTKRALDIGQENGCDREDAWDRALFEYEHNLLKGQGNG